MGQLRNSVKAVIIREGQLLVTVNRDAWGEFLLLPGGGQRFGETMIEALKRECQEEIGCDIVVKELLGIREYIGAHHEFAAIDAELHQIEIMFLCELAPGCEPQAGKLTDKEKSWEQTGIAWLPLFRLRDYRIYPSVLAEWLQAWPHIPPRYWGDVN